MSEKLILDPSEVYLPRAEGHVVNLAKQIEWRQGNIWEPHWRAEIGPLSQEGDGVPMPKHFWDNNGLIDLFIVHHIPNELIITVDLKTGAFLFNGNLQFRPPLPPRPITTFYLIWHRQMEQEMFDFDHQSSPPWCNHYALGWSTVNPRQPGNRSGEIRAGYIIYRDGRITEGL